jgi:hypothetical protein
MDSKPTVAQRKAEILRQTELLREETFASWNEVRPTLCLLDRTSCLVLAARSAWSDSPWIDLLRGRTMKALWKFARRDLKNRFSPGAIFASRSIER